ncbi:hypothetical protein TEA_002461 [Camellia sinensis var. sinensis]|uniref:Uncharacterized protein n=1 Tax=Camellia sinensis var. sinensis TaxID=542762 RepID=A0A4S4DCR3_CAMSN|nr:hypothetical protein TEA_002461 [Camellia sinensis var. sinensis]
MFDRVCILESKFGDGSWDGLVSRCNSPRRKALVVSKVSMENSSAHWSTWAYDNFVVGIEVDAIFQLRVMGDYLCLIFTMSTTNDKFISTMHLKRGLEWGEQTWVAVLTGDEFLESGQAYNLIVEGNGPEEEILSVLDVPPGKMGCIIGRKGSSIFADILIGGAKGPPDKYLVSAKQTLRSFITAASGGKGRVQQHAIPLSQQLEYYKEYQAKLAKVAGNEKARSIIKDGLYILSAGNSDFLQNYYVNPFLYKVYTPDQYSSYLVTIFSSFVKKLYNLGARRIGVTPLPPLGCVPLAITLFGMHESGCVSRINNDAQSFNKMINSSATNLQKQLPGLKIVVFDIYKSLYNLVKTPSNYGFAEARRGCCGTGIIETTWLLCNPKSRGTCRNATEYVFWDSVHPSQAANQLLANALILQGISLIG